MSYRLPVAIGFAVLVAVRTAAADFDLATSTNQVGIDLYRQLAAETPAKNLAISPYSIESALALAYAGADGETRAEMGRVLYFPPDDQAVQAAFAGVRASLDRIASDSVQRKERLEARGGKEDIIEWHAANRFFGQKGYAFRDSFLSLMKDGYDAPFEPLDFKSNPERARMTINSWVDAQTESKIRDLIPADGLDKRTRLVLVNALYLKAPWVKHFEKKDTADLPFYSDEKRSGAIPTMRSTAWLAYAKEDGFTAVALRYLGNDLQFLILLPDERDGLGPLIAKLTPALLRNYVNPAVPMSHRICLTTEAGEAVRSVSYHWRFKGRENSIQLTVRGEAREIETGSEEEFITEHYWGYARRKQGRTLEYQVTHPRWRTWSAEEASFSGEIEQLYGNQFSAALGARPTSAFLADGSEVTVFKGRSLLPD